MMRIVGVVLVKKSYKIWWASVAAKDCLLEKTVCRRHWTDYTGCLSNYAPSGLGLTSEHATCEHADILSHFIHA